MANILLIEDDPLLGAMLREMLQVKKHTVTWVRSGVPAKRIMQSESRPSLILTDIVMPDMDGLETIQYLSGNHPDVPIIAMSGIADNGYLTLASRLGARVVLLKPFSQEKLFSALDEVLTPEG